MPPLRVINIVFAGINFPSELAGIPYEVNRSFELPKESKDFYHFVGEPDANGIWPDVWVKVDGGVFTVEFKLLLDGGNKSGIAFSGIGPSPLNNKMTITPPDPLLYGGTATIT